MSRNDTLRIARAGYTFSGYSTSNFDTSTSKYTDSATDDLPLPRFLSSISNNIAYGYYTDREHPIKYPSGIVSSSGLKEQFAEIFEPADPSVSIGSDNYNFIDVLTYDRFKYQDYPIKLSCTDYSSRTVIGNYVSSSSGASLTMSQNILDENFKVYNIDGYILDKTKKNTYAVPFGKQPAGFKIQDGATASNSSVNLSIQNILFSYCHDKSANSSDTYASDGKYMRLILYRDPAGILKLYEITGKKDDYSDGTGSSQNNYIVSFKRNIYTANAPYIYTFLLTGGGGGGGGSKSSTPGRGGNAGNILVGALDFTKQEAFCIEIGGYRPKRSYV